MLSVPDAAARLGVNRSRVLFLVRAGRIKATRVGKVWIIHEADLAAWQPLPPHRPRKRKESPPAPRKPMGRPRIHPPKDPNAPKRPRGRPRKIQPDADNPKQATAKKGK